MRIATWNVNSIKQRMDNLTAWLSERQPDIVCLQETKSLDDAFPREAIEALGYNVAVHGQKAFNGVALLSKLPFDEVTPRLPGDEADTHARFLEGVVSTAAGAVRVASIYLPNGNPPDTDKYTYKLNWMDRLTHYAHERLKLEESLVLAGDFNVIPTEVDARNPARWVSDALFLPRTREKFRALCNLGHRQAGEIDDLLRRRDLRQLPREVAPQGLALQRIAHDRDALETGHHDLCRVHRVVERQVDDVSGDIGRQAQTSECVGVDRRKRDRHRPPQLLAQPHHEFQGERTDRNDHADRLGAILVTEVREQDLFIFGAAEPVDVQALGVHVDP